MNFTDRNGDTHVERFRASTDPDRADPASAQLVIKVEQPYSNHNGGMIAFAPDGRLWIGMGDGGSGGDPHGNGQNKRALLGKMLRLDVDRATPYAIPPDNPFANGRDGRPEIWATGVRNPWRYSFDRGSHLCSSPTSARTRWEEVDLRAVEDPGGLNYGWKVMEGSHCFNPSSGCDREGLTLPVAEYGHDLGCAITGGVRLPGGGDRRRSPARTCTRTPAAARSGAWTRPRSTRRPGCS